MVYSKQNKLLMTLFLLWLYVAVQCSIKCCRFTSSWIHMIQNLHCLSPL